MSTIVVRFVLRERIWKTFTANGTFGTNLYVSYESVNVHGTRLNRSVERTCNWMNFCLEFALEFTSPANLFFSSSFCLETILRLVSLKSRLELPKLPNSVLVVGSMNPLLTSRGVIYLVSESLYSTVWVLESIFFTNDEGWYFLKCRFRVCCLL